jgi:hypothetical protein
MAPQKPDERRIKKARMSDLDGVAQRAVLFGAGPGAAGSRRSTPCAKKFASGASMSRSCFIWVMNRLPFTAKTKPSGVSSCHCAKKSGRCSE